MIGRKGYFYAKDRMLSLYLISYIIYLDHFAFEYSGGHIHCSKNVFPFYFLDFSIVYKSNSKKKLNILRSVCDFSKGPRYIYWFFGSMCILILTSLFSEFPGQTWFGDPNPQTGTLFLILVYLLFTVYTFGDYNIKPSLVFILIIINSLVIIEYIGFRPFEFIVNKYISLTSPFPAVTVGIRTHLSAITLMLLLLPLYWHRDRYHGKNFWITLILAAVGFGCTITSSALLGLLLCLLIFMIIMRDQLFKSILIVLTIILASNTYRILPIISAELQQYGWVTASPQEKNLTNLATLETRLILWKAALEMIKAKPLIGWGNATYNQNWYDFISKSDGDRLFRIELGLQESQRMYRINDSAAYKDLNGDTIPVHLNYFAPHNSLIELVYSQGIIGLLLFCGFIFSLFKYLYRQYGNTAILALLPLIAYGIYLFAWFVTVPATGLAAIILGVQIAELRRSRSYWQGIQETTRAIK